MSIYQRKVQGYSREVQGQRYKKATGYQKYGDKDCFLRSAGQIAYKPTRTCKRKPTTAKGGRMSCRRDPLQEEVNGKGKEHQMKG